MPTARKEQQVTALQKRISESTIAIATDYTGMSVADMTDLRKSLRVQGVDFRVVKNTLTYIAADTAGRPQFKEIVKGPTGVAFGYGEVVEPAKALTDFIRENRSVLKVRGALMGDRTLSATEVEALGKLPSKDELIARLAGQLQGGIAGLVYVLSAPITGLATVLKRHTETLEASPAVETESSTDMQTEEQDVESSSKEVLEDAEDSQGQVEDESDAEAVADPSVAELDKNANGENSTESSHEG